ncbi:Abi family protein [Puia dinghuensis]|uniref:Peptide ABC transporter substrate-binding protein n=1 Tax=Puia dinghuensis TaxID=1792502 RepID=A0A8J2U8Y9_9BACT|nr:Abi family protein [Puia dinghuensis]GGA87392.1 peptide ABC transporter substrate-binding protein [Puia dinghuensis]
MKYTDPALTIDEQIIRLKSKHLIIQEEDSVKAILSSIGYFRLNNYMKYFIKGGQFLNDTVIEDILALYEFDKFLRITLFDAIADIEVAMKSLINSSLCCKYGSHWLTNTSIFKPEFYGYHQSMMNEIVEYCKNTPDEQFIKKYKQTYNEPDLPPTWMILEVMSFGKISMIYDGLLKTEDRVSISAFLRTHDNILNSWLHSLAYVRNLCAHHAKILDRTLTIKPTMPSRKKNRFLTDIEELDVSKIYAVLCVIQFLLKSVKRNRDFKDNIVNLINNNPIIKPASLGFTSQWNREEIWQ